VVARLVDAAPEVAATIPRAIRGLSADALVKFGMEIERQARQSELGR